MLTLDLSAAPPGLDYYGYLSWIASQTPPGSLILEAGTYEGKGARALALDGTRTVHTYDPYREGAAGPFTFHRLDARDIPASLVASALLVYLDVDPHDGVQEPAILASLLSKGFAGLLVCDDIFGTDGMKHWWASVTLPKLDDACRFHGRQGMGFVLCGPLVQFRKS